MRTDLRRGRVHGCALTIRGRDRVHISHVFVGGGPTATAAGEDQRASLPPLEEASGNESDEGDPPDTTHRKRSDV